MVGTSILGSWRSPIDMVSSTRMEPVTMMTGADHACVDGLRFATAKLNGGYPCGQNNAIDHPWLGMVATYPLSMVMTRKWFLNVYYCTLQRKPQIWVNHNISQTWNKAKTWDDSSYIHHDSRDREDSEVVIKFTQTNQEYGFVWK